MNQANIARAGCEEMRSYIAKVRQKVEPRFINITAGPNRYGLAAVIDLEKHAIRDASPKVRSQAVAGGGRAAVQSERRRRARMG